MLNSIWRSTLGLAALALAFLLPPAIAQANIITWTFGGTVQNGQTDVQGIFTGVAGTNIGGMAFSATSTFDTGSTPINPAGCGGSCMWYVLNNAGVSSSITINGITEFFTPTTGTQESIQNNCSFCNIIYRAYTYDSVHGANMFFGANTPLANGTSNNGFYGDLNFLVSFPSLAGGSSGLIQYTGGNINLNLVSFNSQDETPVPEPATLGLFTAGLMSLAGARRRRHRSAN